jgi:hypothetical protein
LTAIKEGGSLRKAYEIGLSKLIPQYREPAERFAHCPFLTVIADKNEGSVETGHNSTLNKIA